MDDRPLIVTARFDSALFEWLDKLRAQHFPPALNFLSAHLTLFHALPGAELNRLLQDLHAQQSMASMECILPSVRFTGRGVQAVVDCLPLHTVRATLARQWRHLLSRQDQQPFRPHVTIQNKTDSATARLLFDHLKSTWTPLTGRILGLDLWHYAGGPWQAAGKEILRGRVSMIG